MLRGKSPSAVKRLADRATVVYWRYGYGRSPTTFEHTDALLAAGCRVVGASSYSGSGPSWVQNVPEADDRMHNADDWAREAVARKLDGVIATEWTRIASADAPAEWIEASYPVMAYHAACWWSGTGAGIKNAPAAHAKGKRPESAWTAFDAKTDGRYEKFFSRFFRVFFGINDAELARAACWQFVEISDKHAVLRKAMRAVTRHRDEYRFFVAAHGLTASCELFRAAINWRTQYEGRIGTRLGKYRKTMLRERFAKLLEELEASADEVQRVYAKFLAGNEPAEVVASRLGFAIRFCRDVLAELDATEDE